MCVGAAGAGMRVHCQGTQESTYHEDTTCPLTTAKT
jgi:hypothetical protein